MAIAFRIGRVTQEKQHAGVTELPKPLHVGRKAVRGRRVELEVARVDDAADRRFNRERDRVRDRVADSDCLDPKRRSEEHTSELQSRLHLVCRLLLEKKKKK